MLQQLVAINVIGFGMYICNCAIMQYMSTHEIKSIHSANISMNTLNSRINILTLLSGRSLNSLSLC